MAASSTQRLFRFVLLPPSDQPLTATQTQDFYVKLDLEKMDKITKGSIVDEITLGSGQKPSDLRAAGLNVKTLTSALDNKTQFPVMLWPKGKMVVTAFDGCSKSPVSKDEKCLWSRELEYVLDPKHFPPTPLSSQKWNKPNGQTVTSIWKKEQILAEKWGFTSLKCPNLIVFSKDYSVTIRFEIRQALGNDGTPIAYFVDRSFALTGMDFFLQV